VRDRKDENEDEQKEIDMKESGNITCNTIKTTSVRSDVSDGKIHK
jgi:hypothetical protein